MISVVIPLYNKGSHIARAIDSVFSQTIQDFEIVVVNDGSTDNSVSIVEKYCDSRIKLFHQENCGVSAARNRGIEEAKSDLVSFLDADDEYLGQFLETILRLKSKYSEGGAYSSAYEIVELSGEKRKPIFKFIPPYPWEGIIPNYLKSAIFGEPPVCSSAVAIPKYVFEKVGYFSVGKKRGEDLDMWLRIALEFPVAFSTQVGSVYHRDARNRACRSRSFPIEQTLLNTINNVMFEKPLDSKKKIDIYTYHDHLLNTYIKIFILAGKSTDARRYLKLHKTNCFFGQRIFLFFLSFIPSPVFHILYRMRIFSKRFWRPR